MIQDQVCQHLLQRLEQCVTCGPQMDPGTEAWTIGHFDEAVVCRLFGYEDVNEYYHDGSSQNYIPFLRTPSLFLAAADDPFLGRLPAAECTENPHTLLAVTPR